MWGTQWRQRVRLGPLYLALQAADAIAGSPETEIKGRSDATAFATRGSTARTLNRDVRKGVSIVIPDRDAPALLHAALSSVDAALERIDEPKQVIVVANGAPEPTYAAVRGSFSR